jgi:lactobin A/cerein 7B family class IIb bacteriocin
MSVVDLKAYGKRAASDPVVRAKAKSIGLQNVKGQAEYAKTLGLHFDEADMQALAREVKPKGELSEKDLSSVSGGVVTTTAAAVAGAAVAVGTAAAAVTSTTSAGGW